MESFWQVLIGLVGGAGAMLAAAWALSDKLVSHFLTRTLEQQKQEWKSASDAQLEKLRADLSRGAAVSAARVEHLRALWEATHEYGGAIHALAYGTGDVQETTKRMDNFNKAVSRAGVFIGAERYDQLLGRIGGPFVNKLAAAHADPQERIRLFNEFQHRLWPETLGEIETMLTADPSAHP